MEASAPVLHIKRREGGADYVVTAAVGRGGAGVWIKCGTRDLCGLMEHVREDEEAGKVPRLVAHGVVTHVDVPAHKVTVALEGGRTVTAHNFSAAQCSQAAEEMERPGLTLAVLRFDSEEATYTWEGSAEAVLCGAGNHVVWTAADVPLLRTSEGAEYALHPTRTVGPHVADIVWTQMQGDRSGVVDAFAPRLRAARGDYWNDTRSASDEAPPRPPVARP